MNILLFRIRDETLLFLQQFGKSDRAVISGVIIFTLIYLKILPCFDGQMVSIVLQLRVTMAGATFPTNFDSNISEVMNPEVNIFGKYLDKTGR